MNIQDLPDLTLQLIDTYLPSEDKVNLKICSTSLYTGLRMQPFANHQGHFLSRSRYDACYKRVTNVVGTFFNAHQLNVLLEDAVVETEVNFSNHCTTCLHRLPSNALNIPTLFHTFEEPPLVQETGHKCCFKPGTIRRVPSENSTSTPVYDASRPPSMYIVEVYHYDKANYDDEAPGVWVKRTSFACDEACVIEKEAYVRQCVTGDARDRDGVKIEPKPYFIFSYAIDGIRTLPRTWKGYLGHRLENRFKSKVHLIILDCRLTICGGISYNITTTHNGMFTNFEICGVQNGHLDKTITLNIYAPILTTGKEPWLNQQSLSLQKELGQFSMLLHPHPHLDPNLKENILDVTSAYISLYSPKVIPKYFNPLPGSMFLLGDVISATQEVGITPYNPVFRFELDEHGNNQLLEYTYTAHYGYSPSHDWWDIQLNIHEGDIDLTHHDWITLCQATVQEFNIARCRQTPYDDNKVNNEVYVHTDGELRTMRAWLFQGEDQNQVITVPDHTWAPPNDVDEIDMLAHEVLSDIEDMEEEEEVAPTTQEDDTMEEDNDDDDDEVEVVSPSY
jgi:hypothetical protein